MNTAFQKKQYAGFGMNDTLMSKIRFSGIARFSERAHVTKEVQGNEVEYWILKDEFGARVSCFEQTLSESIVLYQPYEISGEVKIGKGGVFLNLKKAEPFNGSAYEEEN
jgi:hypothetical protein